jgi:transposase
LTRLMAPQYAKPYVKRNKTDAADAEAICEAVARPNMRFVPIKTVDQQAVLALHRARALLVRQRTQLANAIRGLLGEFGIIAPKGIRRLTELRERAEARAAVSLLFRQLDETGDRIGAVEADILTWHARSETSQRLATAPGIGPITATALVAAVGDARQFDSARRFAAWLGLTPRVTASGGREKLGKITKAGDRYLRTLLIHGARALIGALRRRSALPRPWLLELIGRRPVNVAATALAHKTARAVWAMLTRQEPWRAPVRTAAA